MAGRDGGGGGTRNECRISFGVMKTFFIYFRYSTESVDTVWFGSRYKLIKYKPRHRACEEQTGQCFKGGRQVTSGHSGESQVALGTCGEVGRRLGTEGFGCAAQGDSTHGASADQDITAGERVCSAHQLCGCRFLSQRK